MLLDEVIEGLGVADEVVGPIRVPFRNGLARVAGLDAVGGGFGEGQPGRLEGYALIGCANRRIAEIPSYIGSQRCGVFR